MCGTLIFVTFTQHFIVSKVYAYCRVQLQFIFTGVKINCVTVPQFILYSPVNEYLGHFWFVLFFSTINNASMRPSCMSLLVWTCKIIKCVNGQPNKKMPVTYKVVVPVNTVTNSTYVLHPLKRLALSRLPFSSPVGKQ